MTHCGNILTRCIPPDAPRGPLVAPDDDQRAVIAARFLDPIEQHLQDAGLGTISEIFEGNEPFTPVGCIAQAWSVALVLQAWTALQT